MFRFTHRVEQWLQGGSFRLLILAGFILLTWGVLAPVGTLVWWLRQSKDNLGFKADQVESNAQTQPAKAASINCYIVYLPGVGDFSANQLTTGEEWFLNRLVQEHPNCVAIRDVFPYSVANKDLAGERLLAPLWQAAEHASGWLKNADALIKIRNLWRFAISVDDRYGPVYSQGIADTIVNRMNAAHPIVISHQKPLKLVLLGTSGGVQVALGAAPYLNDWLKDPNLYVVSAGGDFDGKVGFDAVDRMYHLKGERDRITELGAILFPSRWPWAVNSPFNRARQQHQFTVINSGPHAHDGDQGYFGLAIANPQHVPYIALTFQKVNQLPIWSDANDQRR